MSHIYIPIDYSDVREAIPPGEDIIYSTLMKGTFSYGRTTETFLSHALITPNGFAWTYPKKRRKPPELRYNNWTQIRTIKGSMIFMGLSNGLMLKRIKDSEEKSDFKLRSSQFAAFILPYAIDYAKRKYNELINDPSAKARRIKKLKSYITRKSITLEKEKKRAEKARKKHAKKYGN